MNVCPFCGDKDFDLVGLKIHLLNSCEVFEQTETPLQEMKRRQQLHNIPTNTSRSRME